ncbi:hypothetical protein MNBD_IGNAVI01-1104 [hydrothermal vent metagenome]|uniref:Uncharacterized protein n=1 Tax=hydrothermal vent metagenome TaxID=652676 RepID=A0A3B1CA16_9ZZZZ
MNRKTIIIIRFTIGIIITWQIYGLEGNFTQAQSNNRMLGVVVMVKGDSIKLKGYCIYVKDGKEIRKKLEKDNAWGWNFHGEYIKEVKMQKISGDASFQLFIMEGDDSASGQPVFESDWVSSSKPITYKRKTPIQK